jgi:tetratricopeptide (TPR) repeat protein
LLPPEWEVLALIDGERDVRALAAALGRSDFDVAKTLFGLESAGVIVLLDPGTARRGRPGAAVGVAELVAKAEQALQAKDFGAAGAAAEEAASLQPHDPTVHLLLGRLHLAQGRAPGAADELRRTLRLDPLLVAAHRYLGYALVALGRFAEALESWDQWERLAARSEDEVALLADVQRAREAARVFLGMGAGTHG